MVPGGYESAYPYSPDGKMAGGRDDFDLPDPLIWMAFVASRTERIRFATGILIVPQHNPVVAAKQVATLDHMTGGRLLLGIGVGWLKEEFDANRRLLRGPRSAHGRVRRGDCASSGGAERPTYHGEFVRFEAAYCRPQPVNGGVPIIVGGHSKPAARRAGRLGDGFFPARGASAELIQLARDVAAEHGRDPDALEITTGIGEDLSSLRSLAELGVARVLVPVAPMPGMGLHLGRPEDAQTVMKELLDAAP